MSDVDLLIDVASSAGLDTVEQIAAEIDRLSPWTVDVLTSRAARRRCVTCSTNPSLREGI